MRAFLAALASVLSALGAFAVWEAARNGSIAAIGPLSELSAATVSAILCISLIRQRWARIVVTLIAIAGALFSAYNLVEPFRTLVDVHALSGLRR